MTYQWPCPCRRHPGHLTWHHSLILSPYKTLLCHVQYKPCKEHTSRCSQNVMFVFARVVQGSIFANIFDKIHSKRWVGRTGLTVMSLRALRTRGRVDCTVKSLCRVDDDDEARTRLQPLNIYWPARVSDHPGIIWSRSGPGSLQGVLQCCSARSIIRALQRNVAQWHGIWSQWVVTVEVLFSISFGLTWLSLSSFLVMNVNMLIWLRMMSRL